MASNTATEADKRNSKPNILIVDDDAVVRTFYTMVLSPHYGVTSVESGQEAIASCKNSPPDLILLDIEMPEMDGYETCRQLRTFISAPVIFATACQTLEEHLKAFDAGGVDILTKPVISEILLRKVELAIQQKRAQEALSAEKHSLQNQAEHFLSSVSDSRVILHFVSASLNCRGFSELTEHMVKAMKEFGLEGTVMIQQGGQEYFLTTHGEATALEMSIIEKSRSMGELFQFKRNLVINAKRVSVIVSNMPEEGTDQNQRVRENMSVLTETAEAFCETIDMKNVSMSRAESLQIALFESSRSVEEIRNMQTQMLMDVRLLLHSMTDKVEKTYSWLNTSSQQEAAISNSMNESIQLILEVLSTGNLLNDKFNVVVNALKGNKAQGDVDLF